MIGVKEKLFCWLKLILGLDKGADDLKKELVKWQLGLDHGADFYEGNLVDILTMCKESKLKLGPNIPKIFLKNTSLMQNEKIAAQLALQPLRSIPSSTSGQIRKWHQR